MPATRFLGILLDEKLTALDHINDLTAKINRAVGVIRLYKQYVDEKTLKLLYNAMIVSLLQHGATFWGVTQKTVISKLEKAINRAVRCIANTRSTEKAHNVLKTMTLKSLLTKNLLTFAHKELYKLSPSVVGFEFLQNGREQRTVNANKLVIPHHRSKKGELSLAVQVPRLWNALPPMIRTCDNLTCFKKKLKSHLTEVQFCETQ